MQICPVGNYERERVVTSAAETFLSLAYANVKTNRKTSTSLPHITQSIHYISTDSGLPDIV